MNTTTLKRPKIGLNRSVFPHPRIHCGSDNDRGLYSQMKRGQEVVGNTGGHLRDAVRGCRSYEKQIDTLSEKNVVVGARGIGSCRSAFENIHVDLVAGERLKRQGRHELRSSLRHDNGNVETAILEPAENLRGLVAGNAAADSKGDLHGFSELFFLANYFLTVFLLFGDVGNPEFY